MGASPGERPDLLEAGLWGVAGVVPLVWTDALLAEYTLPKLLALSVFLLASAVGLALRLRAGAALRRSSLELPLLGAGAALALSTAFSADPVLSALGRYNAYAFGLWPFALFTALFYLSAWSLRGRAAERFAAVLLAAGALVGAYALLQAAGLELFARVGKLPEGRAVSTIGSPVYLGSYLALLAPPALHAASSRGRLRVFGALAFALLCAGLWATVSRGAWLAAASGCAGYALWARERSSPRLSGRGRWILAALLAVLAAAAAYRLSGRAAQWRDRPRVELWRVGWRAFAERPWLGWGPDAFELGFRRHRGENFIRLRHVLEYQVHAHNDLLQALTTTGLLGTAAYLWVLLALVRLVRRRLAQPEGRREAAAWAAALFALFIQMKFNPPAIPALALAAALAGALCAGEPAPLGRRAAGGAAAACLLLGLFSLWLSGRLVRADRAYKLGLAYAAHGRPEQAERGYRAALALNRCELEYGIGIVNHFVSRAYDSGADPAPRRDLLRRALDASESGQDCHPRDHRGGYIRGVSALMLALDGEPGMLSLAERELDAGLQFDPNNAPLLRDRARAAKLRGDGDLARALDERARRLECLFSSDCGSAPEPARDAP